MNIQGICILSQQTIFSPTWYGVVAWIIMICFSFLFLIRWAEGCEAWPGLVSLIFFVLFIICITLGFTEHRKTLLNYPSKIECTIEIIDDNAWKELGPNYTVKEKPYEMKEIYIIEGSYTDN